MNQAKKNTHHLLIYIVVFVFCIACSRSTANDAPNDTTQSNTEQSDTDAEIAARLTVVAEDAAIDPVAAPTNITSTKQLGVDIVRVAANTPVPPPTSTLTPVPPTLAPSTLAPPTAAPPTATPPPPTNTPILLPTEPPPTLMPPTSIPPTSIPPTSIPPTTAPALVPPTLIPPTPSSAQAIGNFDGTWSTNVGTVQLTQTGDQVTGSYQLYGDTARHALSGSISGRTLNGTYTGFDGGTFRFDLAPDGGSFDGSWFYQGEGSAFHWCGVRSGPLKAWCGFSGPWESIGDYVPDTPPVTEVIQTGDQIRGTFLNGVYAEIGQLEGRVGREGVGSQLVAIGRWSIAGYSGDFRWELLGSLSDQTAGYSVTSDGVLHQWCNWRPGLSMPQQCFDPE